MVHLLLFLLCAPLWSEPAPDSLNLRILDLCNQARARAGVGPLRLDERLARIALQHSQEMDALHYFGHNSPSPEFATLSLRLNGAGIFGLSSAENLHRDQGYDLSRTAERVVLAWLASPHHRHNLLSPHFNRVGLGVNLQGVQVTVTQDLVYEAVEVLEKQVQSGTSGLHVHLRCRVSDGPKSGAVIYQGRRYANWTADDQGEFQVDVDLPGPGMVAIGQTVGVREWAVETEFAVR